MDDKTLHTGIATVLSTSAALANRPWKLAAGKLVLKQAPTELTLVIKKQSPRTLEPWQRVGMHVILELESRNTLLAEMMGLPSRTVLVRTSIQPSQGGLWNTVDDTPEPLAQAIVARMDGIFPELVRALVHPAGLESIFRLRMERTRQPGRVHVELPEGLARVGGAGVFPQATLQEAVAYYVACLLSRGAVEEAEGFIGEAERSSEMSFIEGKTYPVWPTLLPHLEAMKAQGATATPLPPADWDFEALDAALAAERP